MRNLSLDRLCCVKINVLSITWPAIQYAGMKEISLHLLHPAICIPTAADFRLRRSWRSTFVRFQMARTVRIHAVTSREGTHTRRCAHHVALRFVCFVHTDLWMNLGYMAALWLELSCKRIPPYMLQIWYQDIGVILLNPGFVFGLPY